MDSSGDYKEENNPMAGSQVSRTFQPLLVEDSQGSAIEESTNNRMTLGLSWNAMLVEMKSDS